MKTFDQLTIRKGEIEHQLMLLNTEAAPLRKQLGDIDRQRSKLVAEKSEIEEHLADLGKQPRVSDHAVVRYLERKYGFDFEEVKKDLLTPSVIAAMNMGADGVKIDGGVLKIRRKCVTTFIGNGNTNKKPVKIIAKKDS